MIQQAVLVGLVVVLTSCSRREQREPQPNAAEPSASAVGAGTIISGRGFVARLPGNWRDETQPAAEPGPEVHSFARVDGRGGLTTSHFPFRPGLSPEQRREAAEGMLASRKAKILEAKPGARVTVSPLTGSGDVWVGTLQAEAADLAVRFYLHVDASAAIALSYVEDGAPDSEAKVEERWTAIRTTFTFSPE